MAEPTIIQEQREVVRAVKELADQHLLEEGEAQSRLKMDQESAEHSFASARESADTELRRAFELLQEAGQLVQPRGSLQSNAEILPIAPASLFDTDLLVGIRITTAQMEAHLMRIRNSFEDGSSSTLITAGIVLGAVVAAGAILLVPFMAGSGAGSMSLGWLGAILSPLVLALLVAAARATFLRPYSPEEDYAFLRESMAHVLYMHQVLVEEARSTYERRLSERQARYDETKERIAQSFRQQLTLLNPQLARFASMAAVSGPEWKSPAWRGWTPSNRQPRAVNVGEMLAGIREDRVVLPALVPFPHERALLIKADSHARERAVEAVQSILLRLAATVPPGDLRFTLIDPVGLGQSVADFTSFADVGIGLGEGRAWTEPHQIEQRLQDLVNLVDGGAEAQAFNTMLPRLDSRRANGIAEPCRVLVILDFPNNFSGSTARMLSTIIQKGPQQGVHPIVVMNTEKPAPYGVNMQELEQASTVLAWDGRRFVWQDPDFRSCWMDLDKMPPPALVKRIIRGVSQPMVRSA